MPKQFLELLPGGTMLQLTAERLAGVCGRDRVIVVTGREYGELAAGQLPWLPPGNLLLEPAGRNTAPCIGWAAAVLARRGLGDSVMIVVASDHSIHPDPGFRRTALRAAEAAEKGYLVTMGVVPVFPATGYGYVKTGAELSEGVFRVDSFREKPDLATAAEYLAAGGYLWNSGMFVWKASEILAALREHLPGLYGALGPLESETRPDAALFGLLPPVSIDVGVMEKARNAAVVPADFSWSDIGDWPGARSAGVQRGEMKLVDSENVLVYDATGRLTVVMGLSNVSVVCTGDATLVMADGCAQKLRDVAENVQRMVTGAPVGNQE
jgi:mannose-1-phosphate guanylyltransferase